MHTYIYQSIQFQCLVEQIRAATWWTKSQHPPTKTTTQSAVIAAIRVASLKTWPQSPQHKKPVHFPVVYSHFSGQNSFPYCHLLSSCCFSRCLGIQIPIGTTHHFTLMPCFYQSVVQIFWPRIVQPLFFGKYQPLLPSTVRILSKSVWTIKI